MQLVWRRTGIIASLGLYVWAAVLAGGLLDYIRLGMKPRDWPYPVAVLLTAAVLTLVSAAEGEPRRIAILSLIGLFSPVVFAALFLAVGFALSFVDPALPAMIYFMLGPMALLVSVGALPCGIIGILRCSYQTLRTKEAFPAHCCQQCGYNLTGNVSGVCPECGAAIDGM